MIHRNKLFDLFLLFPVLILIYGPLVTYDFVWDDLMLIRDNPYFRQPFDWLTVFQKGLWSYSSIEDAYPYYRPLVTLVYWLETRVWGFNPVYFHAANICMHLISVFLFWKIAIHFNLSDWGRRVASFFFAIHPAQLSCVAFVSCHGDLMVQVFGLLGMLIWFREGRERWLALIFAFLAMLSKEAGVVIPLVFFAYDLIYRGKKSWAVVLPLVVWIPYFLLRFWSLESSATIDISWGLIWGNQGAFLTFAYISRIFFPVPTSQDPILPEFSKLTLMLLTLAFLFLVFAFFFKVQNKRVRFFGAWFLITTLIIANWAGLAVRFSDQLLYIPMVPFSLLLGLISFESTFRRTLVVTTLVSLGAVSISQVPVWKNDYEFWKNEVRYRPKDPATVMNYISHYQQRHPVEKPCETYYPVFELLNQKYNEQIHYLLLYNLGVCYQNQDLMRSEKYFRDAMELAPGQWNAKTSLVRVLHLQHKWAEAIDVAEKLARDRPKLFNSWRTLGVAYAKAGLFEKAIEAFETARKLNPQNAEISKMIEESSKLLNKQIQMNN